MIKTQICLTKRLTYLNNNNFIRFYKLHWLKITVLIKRLILYLLVVFFNGFKILKLDLDKLIIADE
ncbi:hypothetical protein GCM10011397_09540 [Wenyingzhuangia marina]|nr:hypothetical protein GCM10011397_09540 [Wenyingzhuangia marina]